MRQRNYYLHTYYSLHFFNSRCILQQFCLNERTSVGSYFQIKWESRIFDQTFSGLSFKLEITISKTKKWKTSRYGLQRPNCCHCLIRCRATTKNPTFIEAKTSNIRGSGKFEYPSKVSLTLILIFDFPQMSPFVISIAPLEIISVIPDQIIMNTSLPTFLLRGINLLINFVGFITSFGAEVVVKWSACLPFTATIRVWIPL